MFKKEKLKKYMEENGLSWVRFGEKIGVSGTAVGNLLKGFKQPSVILIKRIAEEMKCTVDELLE